MFWETISQYAYSEDNKIEKSIIFYFNVCHREKLFNKKIKENLNFVNFRILNHLSILKLTVIFKEIRVFLLVLPGYFVLFVFFAVFSVFRKPENMKIKLHFQNTSPYFCLNPDLMLGGGLLSDRMYGYFEYFLICRRACIFTNNYRQKL